MSSAYIALGSNLRRPRSQLRRAVIALGELPDTRLERGSSIYRSPALGPGTQPDFLNAVVLLTTALSPTALLDAMQQIERNQDRVRDVHWGPRTLDLDLLLYGDMQLTLPELTVPHPQMRHRHFVLHPLREVSDTNLVLPDGTDLDTLLRHCPDDGLIKTQCQIWANTPAHSG
jgi:2-amino-4-hydroxy-6-hydroxymethyldihydropteridine diphosphokinase